LQPQYGGLAQLARALPWHGRGHRFDSDILHNKKVRSHGLFLFPAFYNPLIRLIRQIPDSDTLRQGPDPLDFFRIYGSQLEFSPFVRAHTRNLRIPELHGAFFM
jgi:hypothetical protein